MLIVIYWCNWQKFAKVVASNDEKYVNLCMLAKVLYPSACEGHWHRHSCDTACSILLQPNKVSWYPAREELSLKCKAMTQRWVHACICVFVLVLCLTIVKECQLYTQFVTDQSRRLVTYGRAGLPVCVCLWVCLGEGRHQPWHLLKLTTCGKWQAVK